MKPISHAGKYKYQAPIELANPVIDAHPYLSPCYSFLSRNEDGQKLLHGLYAYNYSALISCGITASALSGMRFGLPRLASAVADELFQDHREQILKTYFEYNEIEFVGEWPTKDESEQNSAISTMRFLVLTSFDTTNFPFTNPKSYQR